MNIVTISSKRQITIPKYLLLNLNLHPKEKVLIERHKDGVLVRPLKMSITKQLAGSLTKYIHPSKLGVPFDVIMEETIKKAEAELESLTKESQDLSLASNLTKLRELATKMSTLQNQIDALYLRWSELENK